MNVLSRFDIKVGYLELVQICANLWSLQKLGDIITISQLGLAEETLGYIITLLEL